MKSRTLNLLLGGLVGAMLAGAASAQSTNDVWQHHIEAWEARDLDGIVSDYSEDSVLILNGEIFRGTSEIRGVFTRLFSIFDEGSNRIDPVTVDGRIVYITWYFTPNGAPGEFYGTDTFVIEDGIISVQTIASSLYDEN